MRRFFSNPLIILGLSGSGKSTVADILARRNSSRTFEIGKYVIADAKGCPQCSTPLDHADHVFRSKEYCRFVSMAVNDARNFRGKVIFVGPRLLQELNFLCSFSDNPTIIGLEIGAHDRELRRMDRKAPMDLPNSWSYFRRRDQIERSWGADETLKLSQIILDANDERQTLADQIENFWARSAK